MDEHKKERLERKSASSPFPLPAPLLPRSLADPFPSLARRGVPKERPGTEEEARTARRSKARCVISLPALPLVVGAAHASLPARSRRNRRRARRRRRERPAACRPAARRVPPAEQDPVRAELARRHDQGQARGSLPPVRRPPSLPPYLLARSSRAASSPRRPSPRAGTRTSSRCARSPAGARSPLSSSRTSPRRRSRARRCTTRRSRVRLQKAPTSRTGSR